MATRADARSGQKLDIHAGLDRILYAFSTYALPVLLVLGSLAALVAWDTSYSAPDAKPLPARFLPDASASLSPDQALEQLASQNWVPYQDSKLAETPFWFTFIAKPGALNQAVTIELPSRHTMEASCWTARPLRSLGGSDRVKNTGSMDATRAGFSLALGQLTSDQPLLCRAVSIGPARLSVVQWPADQLLVATEEFHRNSGLLEGGLIVLALFEIGRAHV